MYVHLQSPLVDISNLYCIPFDYAPHKNDCEALFGRVFTSDDIIIYTQSNETVVLLGYFSIDETPIRYSKYYEFFVANNIALNGVDPSNTLTALPCKCIKEWCLSDILKNEKALSSILTTIITSILPPENKTTELWFDGINELYYYPIRNDCNMVNMGVVSYFVSAFMNEH